MLVLCICFARIDYKSPSIGQYGSVWRAITIRHRHNRLIIVMLHVSNVSRSRRSCQYMHSCCPVFFPFNTEPPEGYDSGDVSPRSTSPISTTRVDKSELFAATYVMRFFLLLQPEGAGSHGPNHAFRCKVFKKPTPCHLCHQPILHKGSCCRGE